MNGRKIFTVLLMVLSAILVYANGQQEASQTVEEVTLEVAVNYVGNWSTTFEELLNEYEEANPHVTINYQAPGGRYEEMMKIKMAANDLPDVFSTHGWAKVRYGDFLLDLSGESWAGTVADSMKEIVFDGDGMLYVLPFDSDKSGPIYNVDIFNEYGLEVPETLDDLLAVSEEILKKSNGEIVPITCAAEGWPEAMFFNFMATSYFISDSDNNYGDSLLSGSFDWTKWEELAGVWKEMFDKGYINKDMLTSKFSDNIGTFAEGKAAIGMYGPYFIEEVKKINPDLNADMMPIPVVYDGDMPTFAGGEKSTVGVWKDSDNKEEALKLLDFLARPENVAKISGATKLPPGINNVTLDAGELTDTFERYEDSRVFPYFDRVYLPSGMWDYMCKTSQMLISGTASPQEVADEMKVEYLRLRSVQ